MRALRVNGLADGLAGVALEDMPFPAPGEREALVRVRTSSPSSGAEA